MILLGKKTTHKFIKASGNSNAKEMKTGDAVNIEHGIEISKESYISSGEIQNIVDDLRLI